MSDRLAMDAIDNVSVMDAIDAADAAAGDGGLSRMSVAGAADLFSEPLALKAEAQSADAFGSGQESPHSPRSPRSQGSPRWTGFLDEMEDAELQGTSCGCLRHDNSVRLALFSVVTHPWTELAVMVLVFINAGITYIQVPGRSELACPDCYSMPETIVHLVDLFTTVCFTLETLMKIAALGLVNGSHTYLARSAWNQFDFFLVVSTWALIVSSWDWFAPRPTVFRVMRVLKPLRRMTFFATLSRLTQCKTHFIDLGIFVIFLMVVFGTLGIQLFAGIVSYQCADLAFTSGSSDEAIWSTVTVECPHQMSCGGSSEDLLCVPRLVDGKAARYGFDNIWQAVLTQFVVLSFDNWAALAATMEQADADTAHLVWPFFAMLTVVLGLILTNMFVSIVCYAVSNTLDDEEGQTAGVVRDFGTLETRLHHLFSRIDADRSGQITAAELATVAEILNLPATRLEIAGAIKEMDQDADGAVDFRDFARWWWNSRSRVSAAFGMALDYECAQARAIFDRLDIDKSGSIEQRELAKILSTIEIELEQAELFTMFDEMDAIDTDSSEPTSADGVVVIEEFVAWWIRGSSLAQKLNAGIKKEQEHIKLVYSLLTPSSDGIITSESLTHFTNDYCHLSLGRPQVLETLQEMQPSNSSGETGQITTTLASFGLWFFDTSGNKKWATKVRRADNAQMANIRRVFEEVDQEHDGIISAEELMELQNLLQDMPGEGKTSSGTISLESAQDILLRVQECSKGGGENASTEGGTEAGKNTGVTLAQFRQWLYTNDAIASVIQQGIPKLLARLDAQRHICFIPGISSPCLALTLSKHFDMFIVCAVMLNTVFMACEHYEQSKAVSDVLWWAEVVLTAVYATEVLIKNLGIGPVAYFRSRLNQLDFTVAAFAVSGLIIEALAPFVSLRVFRLLTKLLRLLRLLSLFAKNENIVMLVRTVTGAPAMVTALTMFLMLVLVLASLIGSILLGPCHMQETNEFYFKSPSFPRVNYFTFSSAIFASFQVMTGENWSILMYEYMDCYGPAASLYFVGLFCVSNIILLNIFVAFILTNFELNESEKLAKQQELLLAETEPQVAATAAGTFEKLMADGEDISFSNPAIFEDASTDDVASSAGTQFRFDEYLDENKPDIDSTPSQLSELAKLVTSTRFEALVLFAIFVSCVATAVEGPPDAKYLREEDSLKLVLALIRYSCFVLFWIELILRVIGLGIAQYFEDGWNRLDCIVVVASTVDLIFEMAGNGSHGAVLVLRCLRPLRLLRRIEGFRIIIDTLNRCIPTLVSVLLLVMLIFVTFALIGMGLFMGRFRYCQGGYYSKSGKEMSIVPMDDSYDNSPFQKLSQEQCDKCLHCAWINPPWSFDTFYEAMKTVSDIPAQWCHLPACLPCRLPAYPQFGMTTSVFVFVSLFVY